MTEAHATPSLRSRTVGDLAASMPGATAVFRRFKLDFCCRGEVVLDEAARQRGVDADEVERALLGLQAASLARPESFDTPVLIAHVLARYHETHRRELPELVALARKVEAVHADNPNVPRGLALLLRRMQEELETHMQKEEMILFPAMQRMQGAVLDAPIGQMRHDHLDHGAHLEALAALTTGFVVPAGACRSWQALYAGAAKLTDDLMQHIHLENNVLFPRFQLS